MNISITRKCEVLNVNKSSYYKWLNSDNTYDDTIDKLVIEIFNKHKGTYGKKRIVISLKNMGYVVNHKKVYRIMKKHGLKARIRRKWRVGKYIKHNTYDNVLDRDFKATIPNEKYTSDVTQLKTIGNKKYYLYPIVDLYNNEIKAYSCT
ncbi:MAG: IS3 family transposase [Bacilli bacterium]